MRDTRFMEPARRPSRWLWLVPIALLACSAEPSSPPVDDDDGGSDVDAGDGQTVDDGMEPLPEADATPSNFIDAQSYFQVPEEIDAWFELMVALRAGFDGICGDTFCEGDFSNYQSLRFRCSVETSTAVMGGCVWVFGASNEEIAPDTGAITVDGRIFTCAMPIAPGTDIRAFVQALSGPDVDPLRAPLPGTDRTLFDGLADCL
jgi:hypothetical protein